MTNIFYRTNQPVIKLAAQELKKYLEKASRQRFRLVPVNQLGHRVGIWVFSEEEKSQDEIVIRSDQDRLLLTGSNPRSVLFAVYAYLEKLGFAFLFPGRGGEVIPQLASIKTSGFNIREKASYAHRGITIEGYPGKEHILNMIDWMAKHRFNEYFLQFQHSLFFLKRFYQSTSLKKLRRKINLQVVKKMDREIIREIKKRGLILERCGHGWTAEVLGLPNLGWWEYLGKVPERKKVLMALTGGKRQLFGKIPINTELCYANLRAFNQLVRFIVSYIQKHPEVDILHFWLSDAHHNWCECPKCRQLSLSDWYARLIKAVSQKAKDVNPQTKIVFLSYENTLQAPRKVKLVKADNLIFMFAPITRCYYHPLTAKECNEKTHNLISADGRPRTNQENLKYYYSWKKAFSGDSFLFDYHFMSMTLDFLGANLPEVIYRDMKDLKDLGLNGMLSCQSQRIFWPSGLPMVVMAKTLWNRQVQLEEIRNDYLKHAFGENNGKLVADYFQGLYGLLLKSKAADYSEKEITKALLFLRNKLKPLYQLPKNRSRQILLHHHWFLTRWLEIFWRLKQGKKNQARRTLSRLKKRLQQQEDSLHEVLDFQMLARWLDNWFKVAAG
ncbi:MAG: DUF4838 domain-containing protein [Candidatus Omnitrophica bacterium]|nr:DUF4838 domain-containing protein [Candidatus Omnitrophota bacterium]